MPQKEFETHRSGLISQLVTKANFLNEKTNWLWTEIFNGEHEFARHKILAAEVAKLQKAELADIYQSMLLDKKQMAKLCLVTKGDALTGANKVIASVHDLKHQARDLVNEQHALPH